MLELIEAIDGLARLLERKKKKKRRRTPGDGYEEPEPTTPAPEDKKHVGWFWLSAFGLIGANGKPRDPLPILPGDSLYIALTHQPGAGTISRDPTGRLFGRALGGIPAGEHRRVQVALYLKRWVAHSNSCEACLENQDAGWILADETFPSGDEEPPDIHPNCQCDLEMRNADDGEQFQE